MQRGILYECCLILQFLCLLFIGGCSTSRYNPAQKAREANREAASEDIYAMLADYPALEASFTAGALSRATFEELLFKGLLGDKKNADMLVAILDGLPALFDARSVPEGIFEDAIVAEMDSKGALPDLFAALACLPRHMLTLPEAQKQAFYAYLDRLDAYGRQHSGAPTIREYLRRIVYELLRYQTSLEPGTVNARFDLLVDNLTEKQPPQAGRFDFADLDDEIGEIATLAPAELAVMFQGGRDLLTRQDSQALLSDSLFALGRLLGDPATYPKTRAMLTELDCRYDVQALGELFERIWTRGAVPGARVAEMGIDGYGKAGKMAANLRELLAQPRIVNAIIETIAAFDRAGYRMDGVDAQLRAYIRNDPFLHPRDGTGEFGTGRFYSPSASFSYKNFSGFRGFMRYVARWNVPLSLTSNFLYEGRSGGERTKLMLRTLMPSADAIPFASLIWAEVYEKGEAYGHGHPVRELRGYGMLKDGVYVAPICPDVITGASMALAQVGDALINGPYDNIYDNMRWCLYERKYYTTIDLVQFTRRIPMVDIVARPYFMAHNIKSLPIVLKETRGIYPVIYMDLNDVIAGVLKQIDLAGLPD